MPTEQMVLVPKPLSRAVAPYSPIPKAGSPLPGFSSVQPHPLPEPDRHPISERSGMSQKRGGLGASGKAGSTWGIREGCLEEGVFRLGFVV